VILTTAPGLGMEFVWDYIKEHDVAG